MTDRSPPRRIWIGVAGLALSEILLFRRNGFVTHYFTPLVWTFYILLADGLVEWLRGTSRISYGLPGFLWLGIASIGLWYVFEGYNLRMEGWRYLELPENMVLRLIGYFWSFATIAPGILVTCDLLDAIREQTPPEVRNASRWSSHAGWASIAVGVLLLASPFLVSRDAARYLWAPVWAGFIFLIDPLNARLGRVSILADLAAGRRSRLWTLLASGLICGFLWEFWNYWAVTKWVYTFPFPLLRDAKLFEMPIAGFLGFPPFAVEIFVMVELVSVLWGGSATLCRRREGVTPSS